MRWTEARVLPGTEVMAPHAVDSLQGPGLGVDGGRPLGLVVVDHGDAGASVAWSQKRAHQSEEAPFERVSRRWDGARWQDAERHRAVLPWVGLDHQGRDWGVVPAAGNASAMVVDDARQAPLPGSLVLDRNGLARSRLLQAPALAPGPDGRTRLLARRLGSEIEVLVDDGDGWRTLGTAASLDHDRIRPVGAPSIATSPTGEVLVAWAVAGEVGPAGTVAAGVAARLWDGQAWKDLSSPTAPVLVDPWPAGPERVSDRTHADRNAQASWKKRWGRRNATDWPGPIAVALTRDGPVLSWNPTAGRSVVRHDGTRWQPLPVPDAASTNLALGRRPGGGLRLAAVHEGALVVLDLVDDQWVARPGLPTEGVGTPALDGRLVAWRARIPGGSTVRLARWDDGWSALGAATPSSTTRAPRPRRDRGTLIGTAERPVLLVASEAEDDPLTSWQATENGWAASSGPEAREARALKGTHADGVPLVAWKEMGRRRPALHAARREDTGEWTLLLGPGPRGSMLERPRKADAVLALGGNGTAPAALVRNAAGVVGLQHRDGRWWTRLPALEVHPSSIGIAGAMNARGEALVASWIRDDSGVRLALHHGRDAGWEPVALDPDCAPMQPGLVSLDLAAGPDGVWALAWRSRGAGGLTPGPVTACTLDNRSWTRLATPPTPRGGRDPRSSETMPVDLDWAGHELLIAVRGITADGPAMQASRWDGTAWQAVIATPQDHPTGPGGLLADRTGACLWWTAEATDGPRAAIACADRSED